MTGSFDLSKTSATCTSTWTGTAHQATATQTVYTYTTPSWDYDNITVTVPADIAAGSVSAVKLSYTGASASGSKSIKFADTRETYSDETLLSRIQAGETSFSLLFSFKATGGTGKAGENSSACYWQNVAVSCEYVPAAAVSGTITAGGSSVYYGIRQTSVALGEVLSFSAFVVTAAQATASCALSIRAHGGDSALTVTLDTPGEAGQQANRTPLVALSGIGMAQRVLHADIQITLTYADGTTAASGWTETALNLIRERVAPAPSVAWTDTAGAYTTIGAYVQSVSVLRAAISTTLDTEADPDMAISSRTLTLGRSTYTLSGDAVELDTSTLAGSVSYTLTVKDSAGQTGTASGTLTVLSYMAPAVSGLEIVRYVTKTGPSGEDVHTRDDDGTRVMVSYTATASALNGKNRWSLTAAVNGETSTLASADDGGTLTASEDTSALTTTLASSQAWTITVTAADLYSSATYTVTIPKAGGIFSIEAGGVAVGKRANTDADTPRFDVAYPAYFADSVYDSDGHELTGARYVLPETAIGTYLGKTLYRKGIELSSYSDDSGDPTRFSLDITPTRVVKLEGIVMTDSYGDLPVNCYHSNDIRAFLRPDGLTGYFIGYSGCSNAGAVVFAEYLKD